MTSKKTRYTVLITTSGIGSRLGNFTQYTNKSLIVVGKKPALARIIEYYPEDSDYVITLGYFGDHVQEFLQLAYPERKFKFVKVSPYEGTGSSLAYSIYCAKKYLQKPFIFHASDTLVENTKIPYPITDWVAGYVSNDATNYASFDANGGIVEKFHAKGMTEFDFVHIGLVGIKSFKDFWEQLEKILDFENSTDLNDISVLNKLINIKGLEFKVKEFYNWIDLGNSNSLLSAKKFFGNDFNTLEKLEESISFINNRVIKFFSNSEIIIKRVKRVNFLGKTTPKLLDYNRHFYSYEFQKGEPMSKILNPDLISQLLNWMNANLWSIRPNRDLTNSLDICRNFYFTKSNERLEAFLKTRSIKDETSVINGSSTPPAKQLIINAEPILTEMIDMGHFHGDFILSNILVSKSGFKLIDWRQDFGSSDEFGDIYYDLAKLNHSLHVDHGVVLNGDFFVKERKSRIECGILRKDVHVDMQIRLKQFSEQKKLSWKKIQVLTALIWLNMSPLHHHPFDKFLYYYGRYNLRKALDD